ncbi:MAG: hypothetical protein U5P10_03235 [Spirochaetia bacterium]|nr:hypothetical protein [Spirochaetia bacterium]
MNRIKNDESRTRSVFLIMGTFILTIALYQNIFLDLPYFYALFSLGMFVILLALYNAFAATSLFENWRGRDILIFSIILLISCVGIDKLGMYLGYWEYPHYDSSDDLRKYLFEWAVALLYHMISLLIGIELFQKAKLHQTSAFFLSMLIVVTPVGFLTEILNLNVYSWRVLRMPFSNFKIGDFFLIFQTLGYWLMALIPYGLYLLIDYIVKKRKTTKTIIERAGI